MDNTLRIYEVGPRDGLQNEAKPFTTEDKKILIDGLIAAGLNEIEVASFVHPKLVPQMADGDEVARWAMETHGQPWPPRRLIGLVLNEKGYDRALTAGCNAVALGVAVSETFSQRNTNMSSQRALEIVQSLVQRARTDGLWVRVYLMTSWVCPFEGNINPWKTISYAEKIWELGIDELAIADTIGHANPTDVGNLMGDLGKRLDMDKLAVHLHDTLAFGLANTYAALSAGVRIVDSSIGGLGGCPFAPGAAGNLATEDLVMLAYKMGLGTGVDFQALWPVVYHAEKMVGRRIGGRIRAWWESECRTDPVVTAP